MPKFVTQLLDATGADASEVEFDFESLADAKLETRAALGEMGRDGLPDDPMKMISAEIFDKDRNPLLELRPTNAGINPENEGA
jgi:hypothetical protein